MVLQIGEVLKELGWSDGFYIPVADEVNKKLEKELEGKTKRKVALTSELEALTERLDAITSHTRRMRHERQEGQALTTAQGNEIRAVDDEYRVRGGERLRIEQEGRQAEKTRGESEGRNKLMEHDLQRHSERVEELKKLVKWDREALLAWDEDMARGEDDNTMLMKYAQEDDGKMKSLELQRQRLRVDCLRSKDLLDRMINDVRDRELQLEKTAMLFQASHRERQAVIRQWEHAVQVLQARDSDIRDITEEVLLLREVHRDQEAVLQDYQDFHDGQEENNRQAERAINVATRRLAKSTEEEKQTFKMADTMNSELMVMKRTLIQTARKLEGLQTQKRQLKQEREAKMMKRDALLKTIEELKAKEDEVKGKSMTVAERAKQLSDMIEAEEKRLSEVLHNVKRLGDSSYRVANQLVELRQKGEALVTQIGGVELFRKQQGVQQRELEHQLEKQREYVYSLDYKASTIQAKLDHLAGDVKEPGDLEAQERKICELEATLAEKTEALNLLTTQLTRLEEDMRRLSQCLADDQSEVSRLQSQRQHQKLMVEGGLKQLKTSVLRNQERQVEENVLRLRVEQASSSIKHLGGRVYSLEKQKLELEAAMKERHLEIAAHKDVLKIRKRTLMDERSKLSVEIAERAHKVTLLQGRHDIAMCTLGRDEEGEQLSITKFKITSLQEKYTLQEEGDELDAKIRTMEKEIRAMENTLVVVNATNDTYKKSLSAVDKDDPEYQERLDLESRYFAAMDHLRIERSRLAELNKDIKSMEETWEELAAAEEDARAALREKEQRLVDTDKELGEQQAKLARADKQLRKLQRDVRANTDQNVKVLEERDVDLRELLEQNMSGLQQLSELVTRHPQALPIATRYLREKNLSLPVVHSPGGTRSSLLGVRGAAAVAAVGGGSRSSLLSARSTASNASRASVVVTPSIVTVDPFRVGLEEWSPNIVCGSSAAIARRSSTKSKKSQSSVEEKKS